MSVRFSTVFIRLKSHLLYRSRKSVVQCCYGAYNKASNYICQEVNSQLANKFQNRTIPDFEQLYPDGNARASECAMNLALTADLLINNLSHQLQPFDLTPASGLVLSMLADSAEPLPPHEIAKRLIVSRATMTGLVDSLERRAYVNRRPHPTDRRMLLVEITDKGRQAADEFRPIVHRHHRMWFEPLDEKEKERLIDFLHRIQASLNGSEN